jgi:hypothetical protein
LFLALISGNQPIHHMRFCIAALNWKRMASRDRFILWSACPEVR